MMYVESVIMLGAISVTALPSIVACVLQYKCASLHHSWPGFGTLLITSILYPLCMIRDARQPSAQSKVTAEYLYVRTLVIYPSDLLNLPGFYFVV